MSVSGGSLTLGGGEAKERVPWTQCLLALQLESSGGPRWGTTARLQGWTPSRVERKSPCLPQLLVLPLLWMSCLPE